MIKFSQSLDAEYRAAGRQGHRGLPRLHPDRVRRRRPASQEIMDARAAAASRRPPRRWSRRRSAPTSAARWWWCPAGTTSSPPRCCSGLPEPLVRAHHRRRLGEVSSGLATRGRRDERAFRRRGRSARARAAATLAQRLAPTGKTILILERGEHVPREAENWSPKAVFIQHRYRTKEQWYDKHGQPFTPNTHYWVGGNTTFYGAALLRLRKGDFERDPARRRRLAGLADQAHRPRALLRRGRAALAGARRARRRSRPRTATSRPTPIPPIQPRPRHRSS